MLNKTVSIVAMLALIFSPLQADEIKLNPDQPDSYVVEKGDTLWDISSKFLQEPWRWPEIWQVNPQIADPHLIYPGDVISMTYEDGVPMLTVDREGVPTQSRSSRSGRTVKLSPEMRSSEHAEAIPTIPIDVIEQFLVRPLVVTDNEMDDWPYIVSSYDNHLVAGKGSRVYVRGLASGAQSQRFSVYRKGTAYQSSGTAGKVLGYEALHVADAVIERGGDPAVAVIIDSSREVLVGDRLVAQSSTDVSTDFIPRSPSNSVNGNIISVIDGVSEIGQYQVVVLNLGESDGIEIGNVVGVYQSGELITDKVNVEDDWRIRNKTEGAFDGKAFSEYLGKKKAAGEEIEMPEEYAAVVMVFRIFGKVSYGLVMEAEAPIHLNDMVRNL